MSLSLEAVISVAEEAMERGGDAGQTWHIPKMHVDDPRWDDAHREVESFVQEALASEGVHRSGPDRIKVFMSTWGMEGAQAATDGMNSIQVARETVNTMTLLHEVAHVVRRTSEGAGHDLGFVETAARLYRRYIGPSAAETFLNIVGMSKRATASGHREGGVRVSVGHMIDLYHRTTPEAARAIYEGGFQRGRENTGELYFSTFTGDEPDAQAAGYGEAVVHVRVPEGWAELDDEFPSGEQHYRVDWRRLRPEHFVRTASGRSDTLREGGFRDSSIADKDVDMHLPSQRTPYLNQVLAEANKSGVMVCLNPPEDFCDAYAQMDHTDEDADQLHVTLLYLGETEELGGEMGREMLYRACYHFASTAEPITGKVNGWGMFLNGDENVLVALWDIPKIAEFRTDLLRAVARHGISREDDHGFTPHMTLAYHEGKPEVPDEFPLGGRGEVTFDSIWIAWGDDEWQEVRLGGGLAVAAGHALGGRQAFVNGS